VSSEAGRLQRLLRLLADPHTPKLPRLAVILALVYLVWPVDLVPDYAFPVVGWLDDLVILWTAVRWLVRSAGARSQQEGPPAEAHEP
jgi:uncharacterized membrane protein YkvA (DUF1232 family)